MNPNIAFIQTYYDTNYAAMQDSSVLVVPYTQAQVYEIAKALFHHVKFYHGDELTLPEHLLDTLGSNTLSQMVTGPIATPDDLVYIFELLTFFVRGSEEVNGLLPENIMVYFVNEFLSTIAPDIDAICAAVATPAEAAAAARALLRIKGLTEIDGVVEPTDVVTAMDSLQTAMATIVPADSAELNDISAAISYIYAQGENDQTVLENV